MSTAKIIYNVLKIPLHHSRTGFTLTTIIFLVHETTEHCIIVTKVLITYGAYLIFVIELTNATPSFFSKLGKHMGMN